MNSMIRADGSPVYAMAVMLTGAVLVILKQTRSFFKEISLQKIS